MHNHYHYHTHKYINSLYTYTYNSNIDNNLQQQLQPPKHLQHLQLEQLPP